MAITSSDYSSSFFYGGRIYGDVRLLPSGELDS